jgi:bifunctional UDP-N-acetylglucosamine pyrophosphorylase/glucosamine-1-phosphate N-acetyltransferase
MTERKLAVIILAAGHGTRMKSARPKVLHEIAGRPMLSHVLESVSRLAPERVVVVVGPDMPDVIAIVGSHEAVVQNERLGTGHAVLATRSVVEPIFGSDGPFDLLIVNGDAPLIGSDTLAEMRGAAQKQDVPFVCLAFSPDDTTGYGRVILDREGRLARIVEHADANEAEQAVGLCYAGMLLADGRALYELASRISNDNAKGEYYLTDVFGLARAEGLTVQVIEAAPNEVLGVDDRIKLAQAERILQACLREKAMARGVTMVDPDTVWLSWDTDIASDVRIEPNVYFGPGVRVETGAEIKAFSHLEGVSVGAGAQIGPFARLRPGTVLEDGVRIGNFVEVKNSSLAVGAKANHLSYVGDSTVGEGANIGAGTITCNYDGFAKHKTEIGAGAFIGSNTALVAPVRVGERAIVGAGSTITRNVEDDALAIARGKEVSVRDGARRFRSNKKSKGKS